MSYTRTDPDLWGHVRFGLDLFRDLSIPHLDPYSFTSDREWINHEWLAEAITGGAFLVAGNAGLVLLKIALLGGLWLLLRSTLRHEGVDSPFARDVIAAIAVVTTLEQAHHVRPQLFSLLCFGVLLWCLSRCERDHDHRWLLVLPPLFALWANCHGGWIVGGAVVVLFALGRAIRGDAGAIGWYSAAGTASVAATLANPYGVELWTFLGATVGFARADIREWQPIYALDPRLWLMWLTTFGLAVLGALRTRRTELRPERLLVIAALAVMSFQVSRLLAFFALTTLFFSGGAIVEGLRRPRAARSSVRRIPAPATAVAALAFCVVATAVPVVARNVAAVRIDPRHAPEPGAVEFLRTRSGPGRVLTWFDWGEYAIWHLPVGMRVSIDGRRETVYSAALQDRHLRFYFDLPAGAGLPRELNADYVWLPRWLPAARRLETDDDWALAYEGAQSVIFARATADRPRKRMPQVAVAMALPRSFPGP